MDSPPEDTGTDAGMELAKDAAMDAVDESSEVSDAVEEVLDAAPEVAMDVCPDALADGNCLRCALGERVCEGACARPDDPMRGCAGPGCAPCSFVNASATCSAGACSFERCTPGFSDCNMNTVDGCEVPTGTDPRNCGGCGTVCTIDRGTAGCALGLCTVASCDTGRGDCDSLATNGCETVTVTTLAHCGGCGMACAPAHAMGACAAGGCTVASCTSGFANCDGASATGCEVNTQTDVNHCGGCGAMCRLANATATCTLGSCAVMACTEGFADCDRNPANGCEADLRVSTEHCSGCGMACSFTNAGSVCRDRVCALGACNAGFSNCDGDPGNGCEVQTAADPNSCGVCGRACRIPNAEPSCTAGVCGIALCNGNSRNCDLNLANGCETDTATSASHCGACGTVCALNRASSVCIERVCEIASCNTGFRDCDGASANGCEVDTRSDLNHCGSCGNTCSLPRASESCSLGMCRLNACDFGYANCDDNPTNGCEIFLATDSEHCGTCSIRCAPGTFCSAGACIPT